MVNDLKMTVCGKKKWTEELCQLTLSAERLPEIKAGQFSNVEVPGRGDLLLRRPFGIFNADMKKNSFSIAFAIKGEGTAQLAKAEKGDSLQVLLPLGNGFPALEKQRVLVVGGGLGAAPLLGFIQQRQGKGCVSCLGFRNQGLILLKEEFEAQNETYLSTDDGSAGFHGYAAQLAENLFQKRKFDAVVACGPEIMMKSLKNLAGKVPVYVSLEQRMACGIGACLVCSCAHKKEGEVHFKRVCTDGPVFLFQEVFYD